MIESSVMELPELLQSASAQWQTFAWDHTVATLQAALQAQQHAKEGSLARRKQLTEATKAFKKTLKTLETDNTVANVEAMSQQSKTTIKSYQDEIDVLTKRCKTVETNLTTMGTALQGLQDPVTLFQACLATVTQQQQQMQQLLSTVEHVNAELQSLEQHNTTLRKENANWKMNANISSSSSSNHGQVTASPLAGQLSKDERDELQQLRKEVAEYEVEFRGLKNQDITIRKLEARIAELQASSAHEVQDQLDKFKEELDEEASRKTAEALDREAAATRKVASLELQLAAERAGREATQGQLLAADAGGQQREAAWEAQRRILVDDAERLRETLHWAERERDELRLQVAATSTSSSSGRDHRASAGAPPSGSGGGGGTVSMTDLMLERKAYEAEVAELSETATMLREELRSKDEATSKEIRAYKSKLDNLGHECHLLQRQVADLEAQLASAPSQTMVDGMKRELRILKRLEYNVDIDAERGDPEIAGGDEEKDLESVLVAKLRRAESELVTERTSKLELQQQLDSMQQDVENALKEKLDAEKLVAALERDLERACVSTGSPASKKPAKPSRATVAPENPAALQSLLDPDESVSSPPSAPAGAAVAPTPSVSDKADDDHSVATIVRAQRDRLRARCEALEAERDSFKRELQIQAQSAESLKTDNTKLYEKVRYLQSYNKGGSRGGIGAANHVADRDLDLEALEQRYEASVDPFKQFNKAERQRKLNGMSPMERAVFVVARTVLATKEMRTGLFFYVVALHLLVFGTTLNWSHHEDSCHTIYDEHLAHMPPVPMSNAATNNLPP